MDVKQHFNQLNDWFLHGCCHVKCCRLGATSVYTIQPCTGLQCHFVQSHIGRVYVSLAITCHLHFWQNDRDLLRAAAVTQTAHGGGNNSQHRKLTLEKKNIPGSCRDSNQGPFDHESDALTTELSPLPQAESSLRMWQQSEGMTSAVWRRKRPVSTTDRANDTNNGDDSNASRGGALLEMDN